MLTCTIEGCDNPRRRQANGKEYSHCEPCYHAYFRLYYLNKKPNAQRTEQEAQALTRYQSGIPAMEVVRWMRFPEPAAPMPAVVEADVIERTEPEQADAVPALFGMTYMMQTGHELVRDGHAGIVRLSVETPDGVTLSVAVTPRRVQDDE